MSVFKIMILTIQRQFSAYNDRCEHTVIENLAWVSLLTECWSFKGLGLTAIQPHFVFPGVFSSWPLHDLITEGQQSNQEVILFYRPVAVTAKIEETLQWKTRGFSERRRESWQTMIWVLYPKGSYSQEAVKTCRELQYFLSKVWSCIENLHLRTLRFAACW